MAAQRVIGIDIGATKIAAGVVAGKKISLRREVPTGSDRDGDAVLATIIDLVRELTDKSGIDRVGIGIAGATDPKKGVFVKGPNFPKDFTDITLAAILRRRCSADVRIDNDAHCFALGEAIHGAGRKGSRVLGITLGTGIGGGIVQDGTLVHGAHNTAAEIGHTTVAMNGAAVCGCGRKGHLEAYASGSGIAREYARLTRKRRSAREITDLASNGDRRAGEVYRTARRALAVGIADLAHAFDPDTIVIGGGLSREPLLWGGLKAEIAPLLVFPHLAKIAIVRSGLRADANILGAAALFR